MQSRSTRIVIFLQGRREVSEPQLEFTLERVRPAGKGLERLSNAHHHETSWSFDRARYTSAMNHVGIGYDVHQLVAGRKLFLGGVEIPHDKGLDGHSDADVLMHAICDAVLGALGEGDIGVFFPNTDPRWRGARSKIFLEEAARQFSSSLATPELPLQQRAYYNLGNTQFRLGEKAPDPKKKQESWEQALSGYESALQLEPKDDDARFNRDLVKKKLEELKQQQEQKKDKDNKSDDQKKDKSDQSKGDDQKKDDQKKPDDKSDDQKKNKPEEQKPDNKKPEDQNSKDNDAPPSEAANSGKVMPMTPQQAQQLLDAQKAEEKVMIFQPPTRTNRVNKVFKDW